MIYIDCAQCRHAVKEVFPRGRLAYRCGHKDAGQWHRRVVSAPVPDTYPEIQILAPIWCPRRDAEDNGDK